MSRARGTHAATRRRLCQLRAALGGAAALCLALAGVTASPTAARAATHEQINGSGSTWAMNAITVWINDVSTQGMNVTFNGVGSAQGRKDFGNGSVDFAGSDIAYQGHDPLTGESDNDGSRPFAYIPLAAGGTAIPYHVTVQGKSYATLRLSGGTLTKIFTNQIKDWSDPAITADNNGVQLPAEPIIPVVHAEGAGDTYMITNYMSKQFPSEYRTFFNADVPTEYWPNGKGTQKSLSGSDGVITYVKAHEGTIGYDEYSYSLADGIPSAKILNPAGYYTLPTQYNVAVALTKARIDTTDVNDTTKYLTQILDDVYTNGQAASYPISSYSYAIIPTSSSDTELKSTGKRQTLADFLFTSVCQGQSQIGKIGYSALPANLVQADFDQIAKLKQADPNVDLQNKTVAQCDNPTFDGQHPDVNVLASLAPTPPNCDKQGQGPCGTANNDTGSPKPLTSSNPGGGQPAGGNNGGGNNGGGGVSNINGGTNNNDGGGGGGQSSTPAAGRNNPAGAQSSSGAGVPGSGGNAGNGGSVGGATDSANGTGDGGSGSSGAGGSNGSANGGDTTSGGPGGAADPGLADPGIVGGGGGGGGGGQQQATTGQNAGGGGVGIGGGGSGPRLTSLTVSAGGGHEWGLALLAVVLLLAALLLPPMLAKRMSAAGGDW